MVKEIEILVCNSCKRGIANQQGIVKFPCPQCGKTKMVRCTNCREIGAKYTCEECDFGGPN